MTKKNSKASQPQVDLQLKRVRRSVRTDVNTGTFTYGGGGGGCGCSRK